jgi:S1-C subfamily serine protease
MTIQNAARRHDPMKMHEFGVEFEFVEIDSDQAASYTHGLKVNSIENDGLAFRAGIFEGDVIVAMAGWKTDRVDALNFVMNAKKNGYNPAETYIVERDGKLHRGSIKW